MGRYQCLLAALFTLYCVAECNVHYIILSHNYICPSNHSCVTLSEVSSNANIITDTNLSLIFFPGIHILDSTLSISNISELSINSMDRASTSIIACDRFASFSIHDVNYVVISGLRFIGCGASFITHAYSLTVLNSIFEGASDRSRGTEFVLNNTDSAHINNCSFRFNTWGSERSTTDLLDISSTSLFSNKTTRVGGALTILNLCNLVIENSIFKGNQAQYGGAIYIDLNSNIVINHCTFHHNRAVGLPFDFGSECGGGGALFVKNSKVDIFNSLFINNSLLAHPDYQGIGGALVGLGSEITIVDSAFVNNTARNGTGGAIYASQSSFLVIIRCNFSGNEAHIAGVMYLQGSYTTINQSLFIHNGVTLSSFKAGLAIVALYNSNADFINYNALVDNHGSLLAYNATVQFKGYMDFYNCTSTGTAMQNIILHEGGGISAYSSRLIFQGYTNFTLNNAKYGGALFAVESTIIVTGTTEYSEFPKQKITMRNNTATNTAGGMYLYQSTLRIKDGIFSLLGNNAFDKGGGIFAFNSKVWLTPSNATKNNSLLIAENRARLGGGFYLEGTSKLIIFLSSSTIRLIDNYADKGAAIFVDDYTKADTCYTTPANSITPASECFLYISDPYNLILSSTTTKSVLFYNSNAIAADSTIFGGLLDRCVSRSFTGKIQLSEVIEKQNMNGLSYFQGASNINSSNYITSEPVQVCLCINRLPNCTIRTISTQVKKGEYFTIQVTAVDQVRSPIRAAKVFCSLSSIQSELSKGQKAQVATNCTDLTYSVRSLLDSETLSLYADGPCRDAELSRLTVSVNFSECNCPVGFEPSPETIDTSCDCVCNSLIGEYVKDCQLSTSSIVRKQTNSWVSHTMKYNSSTFIVGNLCPFGFCQSSSSTPIRINLNIKNGADVQCSEGRTGMLCGTCARNYSISLGSTRCIRCPDNWYFLFVAVVVGSLLAGLGLAISIMVINFTVSIGTINGFIIYANIVDVYDNIFLPFDRTTFPTLVIGWLNLNPGFDLCFVKDIDMYARTWFRFIFPTYIITIVVIIKVISDHSPRFARLVGKRNPVATLATLLLLSYTSIVEISLIAMTPETLQYITPNGSYKSTVWKPDGNMRFFEAKHAILFFFALILVVLTIIHNILIFSWQWIIRLPKLWILKWTRNQKLNLFIRVHHAPYCDQHRYWTGLLLLVRGLLTLTSTFTETIDPKISLLTLIISLGALFLLKTTLAKKVYKKWPVDALEVVLLFNLFVLASVSWYAIDNANIKRIATYVSITITFVLLLCVIGYHIYEYILISIWPSLKIGQSAVRFYPARQVTAISENLTYDYTQDRFHDIIGSIDIQPEHTNQKPPPKATRKSALNPNVNKVAPTTSVIELLEFQEERVPEQLTVSEEDTRAPYVMMDITSP